MWCCQSSCQCSRCPGSSGGSLFCKMLLSRENLLAATTVIVMFALVLKNHISQSGIMVCEPQSTTLFPTVKLRSIIKSYKIVTSRLSSAICLLLAWMPEVETFKQKCKDVRYFSGMKLQVAVTYSGFRQCQSLVNCKYFWRPNLILQNTFSL